MTSVSVTDLAVIARSDSDDVSAEAQRAKAEAIHSAHAARWIASRSLSSGRASRGPLARTETAALVSRLDLVITVDTSMAHLAPTMGCPTWIMLPHTPDYRWLLDRGDSPWYPTVHLFRQDASRDYAGVIERVRVELEAAIKKKWKVAQAT